MTEPTKDFNANHQNSLTVRDKSFFISTEEAPLASPEVSSETASSCSRHSLYKRMCVESERFDDEIDVVQEDAVKRDSLNCMKSISSDLSKQVKFRTINDANCPMNPHSASCRRSSILKNSHLKTPNRENQFIGLSANNCLQTDLKQLDNSEEMKENVINKEQEAVNHPARYGAENNVEQQTDIPLCSVFSDQRVSDV